MRDGYGGHLYAGAAFAHAAAGDGISVGLFSIRNGCRHGSRSCGAVSRSRSRHRPGVFVQFRPRHWIGTAGSGGLSESGFEPRLRHWTVRRVFLCSGSHSVRPISGNSREGTGVRMNQSAQTDLQVNPTHTALRSGGRLLAESLRAHGVDRVFCVPGESYLDLLDALHDMPDIQIVVAKHEGAAANMAEADGKMTGRPGICIVTRGPGATHASIGVHTAFHDSTPMILLIGQVSLSVRGREAFQEVEFRKMFAPLAKWTGEIQHAKDIPEVMRTAFQAATSGRPGPVVLSLPEDMLEETSDVAAVTPHPVIKPAPGPEKILALRSELERAQRPVMIVGGSEWTDQACADLAAFAEANALPVVASFRRQDVLDNRHPNYIGHLTLGTPAYLANRIKAATHVLAVGSRLSDVTTGGYKLIAPPRATQHLIHLHPDRADLSRVYQTDLPIAASPGPLMAALRSSAPVREQPWRNWAQEGRAEYLEFSSGLLKSRPKTGVDLAVVVSLLSDTLPDDAMICNGAGNYTVWVHRFFKYKRRG